MTTYCSMTVLVLFPEVAHEVSALGKHEVPNTSTKRDRQEQPAIVCHDDEHEEIGIADLDHMQH